MGNASNNDGRDESIMPAGEEGQYGKLPPTEQQMEKAWQTSLKAPKPPPLPEEDTSNPTIIDPTTSAMPYSEITREARAAMIAELHATPKIPPEADSSPSLAQTGTEEPLEVTVSAEQTGSSQPSTSITDDIWNKLLAQISGSNNSNDKNSFVLNKGKKNEVTISRESNGVNVKSNNINEMIKVASNTAKILKTNGLQPFVKIEGGSIEEINNICRELGKDKSIELRFSDGVREKIKAAAKTGNKQDMAKAKELLSKYGAVGTAVDKPKAGFPPEMCTYPPEVPPRDGSAAHVQPPVTPVCEQQRGNQPPLEVAASAAASEGVGNREVLLREIEEMQGVLGELMVRDCVSAENKAKLKNHNNTLTEINDFLRNNKNLSHLPPEHAAQFCEVKTIINDFLQQNSSLSPQTNRNRN